MSRGLGSAQRDVLAALAALDGDGPPAYHPLASLYDGPVRADPAGFEAARRGVHGLARRGLVRVTRRVVDGRAQLFVKRTGHEVRPADQAGK
jgi:hypothetical protein